MLPALLPTEQTFVDLNSSLEADMQFILSKIEPSTSPHPEKDACEVSPIEEKRKIAYLDRLQQKMKDAKQSDSNCGYCRSPKTHITNI
jgi:hypothetical protein